MLPAARERVFAFFADAARLAKWRGPTGFRVPRLEFAPGGATYRIEMQPPEGDAFHAGGHVP